MGATLRPDELRQAWLKLAEEAGIVDAESEWRGLCHAYEEPHRGYHRLDHITFVLAQLDGLEAAGEAAHDPVALRLAAWFHDVVYDPHASDNELSSAQRLDDALRRAGWSERRRHTARRLVMVTQHHRPATYDQALLCDADLAVLATSPARYRAYVKGVSHEYAWLGPERWRAGRSAFLQRMLARDRIYTTAVMSDREGDARRNMTVELTQLDR